MKSTIFILAIFILILSPFVVTEQVLGTCGSSDENEPNTAIESVAPAGWQPGDELIGTGREFIGKY